MSLQIRRFLCDQTCGVQGQDKRYTYMQTVHIQTSGGKHRSLRTERLTEFTKCHLNSRTHNHSITTCGTERVPNPWYQVCAVSAVVQPARVQICAVLHWRSLHRLCPIIYFLIYFSHRILKRLHFLLSFPQIFFPEGLMELTWDG